MFVRTRRISLAPEEPTQGRQIKIKERHGQGSGLLEQEDQAATVEQQPQLALAISLYLASFEKPGRPRHLDSEGWSRWTNDTGAVDADVGTETEANEGSCKTAPVELIPGHGNVCVQETTEYLYGVTFRGREQMFTQL